MQRASGVLSTYVDRGQRIRPLRRSVVSARGAGALGGDVNDRTSEGFSPPCPLPITGYASCGSLKEVF